MGRYDQIPDTFSDVELRSLTVVSSTPDESGSSTSYEVVDSVHEATFSVTSAHPRVDIMSDYVRIVQTGGNQKIFNPTTVETKMWPSSPQSLPERAILTAMREFEESLSRLH